jgi:hypothetical protein
MPIYDEGSMPCLLQITRNMNYFIFFKFNYRGDRGIFGQNSSLPNLSEFLLSKTYIINFEIQPFDSHFSYVFKSFF